MRFLPGNRTNQFTMRHLPGCNGVKRMWNGRFWDLRVSEPDKWQRTGSAFRLACSAGVYIMVAFRLTFARIGELGHGFEH